RRALASEDRVEPLGDLRVVVEAQYGGGLRQRTSELLSVPLGEATSGHHRGAVRGGIQQRVDRVLFGLRYETAAILQHEVVAVGVGGDVPTGSGQSPGELLGVHLVASAAEGQERDPPAAAGNRS